MATSTSRSGRLLTVSDSTGGCSRSATRRCPTGASRPCACSSRCSGDPSAGPGVELDVARQPEARRQGEARQLSHLLAPVATLDQARWLIGRLAPGVPATLTRSGAPPRRAILRAPLAYHYLSMWHDGRWLVTQTGRVRPALVIVPLEKAQSIRLESGPLLRALRLANLRVDTAGRRWVAEALCRDEDEANVLVERLGGLARQARRLSW